MKPSQNPTKRVAWLAAALSLFTVPVAAFDSGSTGADGDFSPTVNTQLQLPADGIFNFSNVSIPEGVTVSFKKNATNTPVTLLATGDVMIAGTLHVNGSWSTPVGAAGDGNIGDDGLPGEGGAGGYAGGRGGAPNQVGGAGLGPGAGAGGTSARGGGGGGFGSSGTAGSSGGGSGGATYGSQLLLPLVGGSGGGGGAGGVTFAGSGGAGGGGALLIAASGTVTVTGSLRADGANSGAASGASVGGSGGAGSGGAIRILATTISGNGTISAAAGTSGTAIAAGYRGGNGGVGRIRFEAENITRTATTSPAYSFEAPSTVFISGLPALRIVSVAGQAAPAEPTGNADIVLAADTPNPVTVQFETTGVPVGNTVRLTVVPANGSTITAISPALVGSTDLATASVEVSLPTGPSTLLAQTTYTIVASLGDALSHFAEGERVEQIRLAASTDGHSTMTLITVSGREYTLPQRVPAMIPAG